MSLGSTQSDIDARAYREWCRARLAGQFGHIVPLTVLLNFGLAAESFSRGAILSAITVLGVGAFFALVYAAQAVRQIQLRSEAVILVAGVVTAWSTATLALESGGYSSAAWALLLLCWAVAATQLSLSWGLVLGGMALQLATSFAALLTLAPASLAAIPGRPLLMAALLGLAAALSLLGSARLHRRDTLLFSEEQRQRTVHAELRDKQRQLARHNRKLEERAAAQVREFLTWARTTEQLETLVAERIRARSRELFDVVDRMSFPSLAPDDTDESRRSGVFSRYGLVVPQGPGRPGEDEHEILVPTLPAGSHSAFAQQLEIHAHDLPHGFCAIIQVELRGDTLEVLRQTPRGLPLVGLMARGDITEASALLILAQAAAALAQLHASGRTHGALDPQRIWMGDEGVCIQDAAMVATWASTLPGRPNPALGTYIPPTSEVLSGGEITPEDDVFLLGAVAFEALAGIHPQAASGDESRWRDLLDHASPQVSALVLAMLGAPESRPSMEQIKIQADQLCRTKVAAS